MKNIGAIKYFIHDFIAAIVIMSIGFLLPGISSCVIGPDVDNGQRKDFGKEAV